MWWMLLAIIGCYAFAALAVRIAARHLPGWRAGMHVVLFAGNQGATGRVVFAQATLVVASHRPGCPRDPRRLRVNR